MATIIISVGFAFALIMLVKMNTNPNHIAEIAQFPISLRAAGLVFHAPGSLLFGVGVDDFAAAYTRVKDVRTNIGTLWQIDSFNLSRSALLHIFTETGTIGLLGFLGMSATLLIKIKKSLYPQKLGPLLLYIFVAFVVLPISPLLYFLLYITFAFTTCDLSSYDKPQGTTRIKLDKKKYAPILYLIVLTLFSLIIASGYLLTRAYSADITFRNSFVASQTDFQNIYQNQRNAVVLNPYIELYRAHLAKTNIVIANQVAAGVQNNDKDASPEQKRIITEAIQAAIAQAKAATTLNPTKATNWETLGTVYANIIGIVNGSPELTTSVYQRAISLDPTNAKYYAKLGTVQYLAAHYNDAANSFGHAAELKQDWASAWYNLAWSQFKAGKQQEAVVSMNKVLPLIDKNAAYEDYSRAQKDLETFKNGSAK